jgi:diguanylate cyclase (GGDEF)-like protein
VPGISEPADQGHDQQSTADRDQTSADTDQTNADLDQSAADSDADGSRRDQAASDSDQRAADLDQSAIDDPQGMPADAREQTRRARAQATLERDITSQARTIGAAIRDANADRRDRAAADRDAAAEARDRLAAELDAEIERLVRGAQAGASGADILLRAATDRKRAAQSRTRAAAHRDAAARDREQAARDREQAARDRQAAAEELAMEGVDHLTGALRRRVGLAAIQREMDRSRRTDAQLVVAFVDVDGLRVMNNTHGHAAGDHLLREVVRSIRQALRAYDIVAHYGGDEFVCALLGDLSAIQQRFEEVALKLRQATAGSTITTGLAEMRPDNTLEDLLGRADAAMLAARGGPTRTAT